MRVEATAVNNDSSLGATKDATVGAAGTATGAGTATTSDTSSRGEGPSRHPHEGGEPLNEEHRAH